MIIKSQSQCLTVKNKVEKRMFPYLVIIRKRQYLKFTALGVKVAIRLPLKTLYSEKTVFLHLY